MWPFIAKVLSLIHRNIAILLLMLFTSVIAEKAIPHHHVEKDGLLIADFSKRVEPKQEDQKPAEQKEDEHEAEEESFHSTYLPSELVIGFDVHVVIVKQILSQNLTLPESRLQTNPYNILPKVLNSILYILHLYSAKAPPFFNPTWDI